MTSRLYATNQQLAVRTVGRFLLAVVTIRGFVSTRPTDNNIYVFIRSYVTVTKYDRLMASYSFILSYIYLSVRPSVTLYIE